MITSGTARREAASETARGFAQVARGGTCRIAAAKSLNAPRSCPLTRAARIPNPGTSKALESRQRWREPRGERCACRDRQVTTSISASPRFGSTRRPQRIAPVDVTRGAAGGSAIRAWYLLRLPCCRFRLARRMKRPRQPEPPGY